MKKILVCTDGSSPYAPVCYDYAAWLAGRSGAQLEILYVSDLRQFEMPMVADLNGGIGLQPYQNVLVKLQELEQGRAQGILDQARRWLEKSPAAAGAVFTHRMGFLVDTLQEFEAGADLIVLGKRGENANFARGHLGSTMERVVRSSRKPCLVTPRAWQPVEKILFAYDGGKSCRNALQFLATEPALRGLELHVVVVASRPNEEAALQHLKTAEADLRAAGLTPVCQMLEGVPEQEIGTYVEARGIGMLVIGAYGHSRIRELIIGSTTTQVIRRCKIAVLLFH